MAITQETFVGEVRSALEPLANAQAAEKMQAYLRDQFAFLGVSTIPRRKVTADALRLLDPHNSAEVLGAAHALWQLPQREYQHVGVDLLSKYRKLLSGKDVPELLSLAREKSWWDSVDGLAGVVGHVVKTELKKDKNVQSVMDEALRHENLWTRRIAMIHQVGRRLETDEARLFSYAQALAPETDFFIRKAIGWALRDYARHKPAEVRGFLARMEGTLSPLSMREAGKHLEKL